jgi:hypothetical protein
MSEQRTDYAFERWIPGTSRTGGLRVRRYHGDGKAHVGVAKTEGSKAKGTTNLTAARCREAGNALLAAADDIDRAMAEARTVA